MVGLAAMVRLFNTAHITNKVRVAIPNCSQYGSRRVVNSDQTQGLRRWILRAGSGARRDFDVCNQGSATLSAIVAAFQRGPPWCFAGEIRHESFAQYLLRKVFVDPAVRLLRTWRPRPEGTHNHAGQMLMVPAALSDLFHK
jgi:hypothetical protein